MLEEAVHKFIPDDRKEIFWNELQYSALSLMRPTYSDNIKQFAMTLYFYSPKAYEFVRKKLTYLTLQHCENGCLVVIAIQVFYKMYCYIHKML